MHRCLEAYNEAQAVEQHRLAAVRDSLRDGDYELEASSLYLGCGDPSQRERLYLPRRRRRPHGPTVGSLDVDEYLSRIPRIVRRIDELSSEAARRHSEWLNAPHNGRSFDPRTTEPRRRCLNVLQGEVAHATSLQADLLVSSGATTCHVVALRSTTCDVPPLYSLAHVDMVNDECLERMIKEHLNYHERNQSHGEASEGTHVNHDTARLESPTSDDNFGFFDDDDDQGRLPEDASHFLPGWADSPQPIQDTARVQTAPMIEMDLHMVGGFLDAEGSSKRLSAALIEQFDDLARKYRDRVRIHLVTAAISCLNHNQTKSEFGWGYRSSSVGPVHRGLGIDTHTGKVFSAPVSLPEQWAGPAVEIRSARRAFGNETTLAVIHTADSEHIRVEPFCYTPDPKLNVLLKVSDSVLLSMASTSPHHESDNFCSNFRRTLSFINTVPPETVFTGRPGEQKQPLVYTRSATNLHEWIRADIVPGERVLCRSLAG